MKLFDVLLSHGIKPVAVFDGQNLKAKEMTKEKRERLVLTLISPCSRIVG